MLPSIGKPLPIGAQVSIGPREDEVISSTIEISKLKSDEVRVVLSMSSESLQGGGLSFKLVLIASVQTLDSKTLIFTLILLSADECRQQAV